MVDISRIGARVADLRQRRSMTQTQLAQESGTHANTIANLERGAATNISVQKLDEIGRVLGERIDVLIRRARAVA